LVLEFDDWVTGLRTFDFELIFGFLTRSSFKDRLGSTKKRS